MPAFEDVVPFFFWSIIGFVLILSIIFVSKLINYVKQALSSFGRAAEERQAEKDREGVWYWVAELFRLASAGIVIIVGYTIFSYLFFRPAGISLYHAVFDDFPIPMVTVIIFYYVAKIVGELTAKSREKQAGTETQGQETEEEAA